ncbi:MAG TPA: AAA family ATPase [Anaerolineae bacterium]|nr:AAA family ATPase [Anaerolineales bacterium]HRV96159.1 AAA family ATPase [Anaerolineae bacterium]
MQVKKLEVAHVRVFDQAEFEFQPGMNLLVGINGAGKSTVLDVLRVMLSHALPQFTASRSKPLEFKADDITFNQGALTVNLEFEAVGLDFDHLIHLPRHEYVIDPSGEGEVRRQTYDLVERNELKANGQEISKSSKQYDEQPLAVYFSTHRSLPNDKQPSRQASAGGQSAAFAEALDHRELKILEFAEWTRAQEALAAEGTAQAVRRLETLNEAVTNFLNDCTNLRAVKEPKPTLIIDKNNATLDIRHLSDGERSVIALVLDLARRLVQANPKLDDPLKDGKAVVLIDELDLHLHPSWQRTICDRLTSTFPSCQFIATTHSPQIVGEVSPDNISLIEQGTVLRPHQSLGMDSNWILRHIMGTSDTDFDTEDRIKHIEALVKDEKYDEAALAIDNLRDRIGGENLKLVSLQTRIDMIEFLSDQEYDEKSP